MEKKNRRGGFRMDDGERDRLDDDVRQSGMSQAAYIRHRLFTTQRTENPQQPHGRPEMDAQRGVQSANVEVHHVDDLGDDDLRVRGRALER